MAPLQSITIIDPLSWPRSTATRLALSELVTVGQLAANEDGRPAAWIDPPATDREPNPPHGYIVSFIRFHERVFATPASRFLRGLCFHYGVELHNFAPNAISQAATFVGVCEGFLGIPVNWDLWVYLFRAELHTATTPEPKTHRAVHAGGVTIAVRETRRELYIPCTMTSNNAEWERGWFYLRNDEPGLPPWTGKVVKEKADSWWHGLSPSSRQVRPDSALKALKALANAGLTAASVLANLHHQRIVPLMERRLHIFEMKETTDPVALAQSRLMPDLLLQKYTATRARRAVNLRAMRVDNTMLWAFTMLPEGLLVSRVPTPLWFFGLRSIVVIWGFTCPLQVMAVNATRSDPPTPRARARARGAAARARAGGVQEGEGDPTTGAPGAEERGVPVARAAGVLLPRDFGVLVVKRGGGGGERWGSGSPREVSLRPPRPEPLMRQKRQRLGRARERPPPGSLRERRRAPRRRRRAPQR
jgi:hypothetical protein